MRRISGLNAAPWFLLLDLPEDRKNKNQNKQTKTKKKKKQQTETI